MAALVIVFELAARAAPAERVDLDVIHRIKAEAFTRSKVMDPFGTLTDRFGPRLTGSPEYDAAAAWTILQLKAWGLANPRLEKWGPWEGRAWSLKRFSAHLTAPAYAPLIGFPLAWSDSTPGAITGEAILLPVRTEPLHQFRADIDRIAKQYAGKLQGRIVMIAPVVRVGLVTQPPAKRHTDADLATMSLSPDPVPPSRLDDTKLGLPEEPGQPPNAEGVRTKSRQLARELHELLRREGVAAVLTTSKARGDGGTVLGGSAGWWEARYPSPLPSVVLTPEHYARLARLAVKKTPPTIELEVKADISEQAAMPANVIAEIPGGAKAHEFVIVGAHLDSWTGGTGAVDNAAGCAVAMEAVRILNTLKLRLDRTVRIALWSGEEQGLLGSGAYVKEHYGDRDTLKLKPEHGNVSAYFNLDNGAGKIRGLYLQSNDAARPVFESWLAPFRDLGVTTITLRSTGSTDHVPFDRVGIPGFQFIQDPLEYLSRTHHSNMDLYDRAQPADLMQASAVLASVVYHAANRPDKIPRKPLPESRSAGKSAVAAGAQ